MRVGAATDRRKRQMAAFESRLERIHTSTRNARAMAFAVAVVESIYGDLDEVGGFRRLGKWSSSWFCSHPLHHVFTVVSLTPI